MPKSDFVFKMLGFANRARKITLGMQATLQGMRKKRVHVVLLASDLAGNSAEQIRKAGKGNALRTFSTKEELSRFFGRRDPGIIGILDREMARSIINELDRR